MLFKGEGVYSSDTSFSEELQNCVSNILLKTRCVLRFFLDLVWIWDPLGTVFKTLGASWAILEASWAPLGRSWGALGTPLGRSWGALGALLAAPSCAWTSVLHFQASEVRC